MNFPWLELNKQERGDIQGDREDLLRYRGPDAGEIYLWTMTRSVLPVRLRGSHPCASHALWDWVRV